MPSPFGYRDLSEIAGSWPIIPTSSIFGSPSVIPGTVDSRATILGIQRETSSGYTVNGRSFRLYVDSVLSTISFIAADPHSLQDVIDRINTVVGSTVAFRDNGYLLLKSDTAGEGSSLRVRSDPASSPTDVLFTLGLFSETHTFAGDLTQAPHTDPKKQVTLPGQLTMAQGESFKADIFNRAVFQMGVNTGRNEGLLSKKRVAFQQRIDTVYASPGAPEGFQFSGGTLVYTGKQVSPTTSMLEDLFVVLDSNGRELTKKNEEVIVGITCTFSIDSDTGLQLVTIQSGGAFADTDEENNIYVVSGDGSLGALRDVPLKILSYIDNQNAIVQDVDPLTGDRAPVNTASIAANKKQINIPKVVITEVRSSQGGSRVEGVQTQKTAPVAPTRVEKNNRIVVVGADFIADAVIVGDRVDWTSHLETDPYDNNAEYRVDRIIDPETIEVVNADWSPAYLNPDLVAGAGTIEITTDGKFFEDPFIVFEALPTGAIPDPAENITILYLGGTTYRDATNDPSVFTAGKIRFDQEVDETTQKALLRLAGPSAQTIDDVLHGDFRINLEDIDYRLHVEHYEYNQVGPDGDRAHGGRHKNIRPDVIDMFPEQTGVTAIIRGASGETSQSKLVLRDSGGSPRFWVTADGRVVINPVTDGITALEVNGIGSGTVGLVATSADESGPTTAAYAIHAIAGNNSNAGSGIDGGIAVRAVGGPRTDAGAGAGGVAVLAIGGFGNGTGRDGSAAIKAFGGSGSGGGSPAEWAIEATGASIGGGGVLGKGNVGGIGVYGEGDQSSGGGSGVFGLGGITDGIGVEGLGTGLGSGVYGEGGSGSGYGVEGLGKGNSGRGGSFQGSLTAATSVGYGVYARGGPDSHGVHGVGQGTGVGVNGVGGSDGRGGSFQANGANYGVYARGGPSGGSSAAVGVRGEGGVGSDSDGVQGSGAGTGDGVQGVAGSASSFGVRGVGTGTAGTGVRGIGGTTGLGVVGQGVGAFAGVEGIGGIDGAGVHGLAVGSNPGVLATPGTGVGLQVGTVGGVDPDRGAILIDRQVDDPIAPVGSELYSLDIDSAGGRDQLRFYNGTLWQPATPLVFRTQNSSDDHSPAANVEEIYEEGSVDIVHTIPAGTLQKCRGITAVGKFGVTVRIRFAASAPVGFNTTWQLRVYVQNGLLLGAAIGGILHVMVGESAIWGDGWLRFSADGVPGKFNVGGGIFARESGGTQKFRGFGINPSFLHSIDESQDINIFLTGQHLDVSQTSNLDTLEIEIW